MLTKDGLARFGEIAASHCARGTIPCVVAPAGTSESFHVEAHGTLALAGASARPDSLFRISSVTKPITAALTLALSAEGLLDLEEPADRLLPELAGRRVLRRPDGPLTDTVPAVRPVTVRDLLTLTPGFGAMPEMYEAEEDWPVVAAAEKSPLATIGPPDPSRQPDPDAWLAELAALPLITQPGERWACNTGAQLLGVLASRATGLPGAEAYQSR
ncbi:MAG TPA: serine hydrolase domain-containing protein [Trebonia sp.]|jgi:CubicO group peptidase (beta-lactamase class C family)|nr:serine hydrolase domain-containing protein [Trebonia sp.]